MFLDQIIVLLKRGIFMKVIQVWLRVFAFFMVFLLSSVSLQAEGSWQMGLEEGTGHVQNLFQWDTPEVAISQGITLQKRPLYVDILDKDEIINIHLCGENTSDNLRIEIWPEDGSGVNPLARKDLYEGNIYNRYGRLDCSNNFSSTLSDGYEFTPGVVGTYQIRLINTNNNRAYFKRFDVYVKQDQNDDVIPSENQGRLWAKRWTFENYSFLEKDSTSSNLYAVVDGGFVNSYYVWELDLTNFAGNTYEIVANSLGLTGAPSVVSTVTGLSACVDATLGSSASSGTCPNVGSHDPVNSVEAIYPIYLSNPTKNYPRPTTIPEITNLEFLDDQGKDDSISPNGDHDQDTGYFTFTTNLATNNGGTYTIAIDIVNDGITGGPGDVFLTGTAVPGANNRIQWDGKANDGSAVPAGDYKAQITLKTGEFHFTAADVETSGGDQAGLTINAVKHDGTIDRTNKVYWDDFTVLESTEPNAYNGDGTQRNHTWGNFGSGGIGNQSFMDTYTIGETTQEIPVRLVVENTNTTRKNIFGEVFYDANGNGVRDSGETGFSNITVALTEGNGNVFYVSTDTNGYYRAFVSSTDTSIGVDVDESMIPLGYVQTAGIDPQTNVDITQQVTLPDGSTGYYVGQDGYRPPTPAFTVVKTQVGGENPVTVPGIVSYEIKVTNTGNLDLPNIDPKDTLPDGTVSTLTGQTGDSTDPGVLNIGEIWTYKIDYTVTQDDINNKTEIVNNVIVTTPVVHTPKEDNATTSINKHGDFTVVKTQVGGENPVTVPGIVSYEIKVTNTGNLDLPNIDPKDTLPDGTVSTLTGQTGDSTDPGVLNIGEIWTYKIDYTVTQDDINNKTEIVNNVIVTTPVVHTPKEDNATTSINKHGDFTVVKTEITGLDANETNQTLSYKINITNTGNVDLLGINVTDTLPDGSTGVLTGPLTDTGTVATLDVGESWIYTVDYNVTQVDLDDVNLTGVINRVNVTVVDPEVPDKNDTAITPVNKKPGYSLVKSQVGGPNPITVAGQIINYEINVTNTGNETLSDVNVTDKLPDGNIIELTVDRGDINNDNKLSVDESWIYKVDYTVTQDDINTKRYILNLVGSTTDKVKKPKYGFAITSVNQHKDLTVEKIETTGATQLTGAGQVLDYNVTLTNTGNVEITDIDDANVTDRLSNGQALTLTRVVGVGDTVLGLNEVWIYTASYTVTQADMNSGTDISNGVRVITPTIPESNVTTPPLTPNIHKDLTVEKIETTGATQLTGAGQVLDYNVTLTNTGNVEITDIDDANVTDRLSNGQALTLTRVVGVGDTVLGLNEVWIYTASYTVTQADMNSGTDISNGVRVITPTIPESNVTTPPLTPNIHGSITIKKIETTGQDATYAGQVLSYEINVTNIGNIDLNEINVTDTLPNGSLGTLIMDNNGSGDDILDIGESWIYSIDYTVTQTEMNNRTDIINNVYVVTKELPKKVRDDAFTPVHQIYDYNITKVETTGITEVTHVGQILNYEINVTNTGNIFLTDLNVTDNMPDGSIGKLSGPGDTDVNKNNLLDVGESWIYDINYTVTQWDIDHKVEILNYVYTTTLEIPKPGKCSTRST